MIFKTISRQNATDDWLTPPALVERLGPFDLDPCGSIYQKRMLAKRTLIWPQQDGLLEPWNIEPYTKERIWCNPPFQNIRKWIDRFFVHGHGILLIPAWTGNRWFRPIWTHADSLYFTWGGLNFINGKQPEKNGKSMFGVAMAAATPEDTEWLRKARYYIKGTLVTKKEVF